jgi:hypothetical protein
MCLRKRKKTSLAVVEALSERKIQDKTRKIGLPDSGNPWYQVKEFVFYSVYKWGVGS